jgi:hypothetical protein
MTCAGCALPVPFTAAPCPSCGHEPALADVTTARQTIEKERRTKGRWGLGFSIPGALMTLLMFAIAIDGPAPGDVSKYPTWQSWAFGPPVICFVMFALPLLIAGWLNLRRANQLGTALSDPIRAPVQGTVQELEYDVHRLLETVPPKFKKEAEIISREMDRIIRHWREIDERLATMCAPSARASTGERDQLAADLEKATDPVLASALQQQLAALNGQIEAENALTVSIARLQASQQSALAVLRRMRAELTVLATCADDQAVQSLNQAAAQLQAVNGEFTATRQATEEVLQLRAGR